ncbi:DUF3365 domain-containing protein [Gimesia chilikensis]|uniref:c-type heme family protein n=1 Tax=Gimesia chilikensis TaxID=2605989 RepID=UPI00118C9B43|nr:DUF3365 domain-containing protein [Gimesia chilikensis]QDT87355.1 hypothetical protein MalM14_50400 [Gimesia chilikensis]
MNKIRLLLFVGFGLLYLSLGQGRRSLLIVQAEKPNDKAALSTLKSLPTTIGEAQIRARILHETIHGALQVIHRDFFQEDESRVIPSHSLEDVFKELNRAHGVKIRWLAVNAKAMNIDNEPKTEFEKMSVKELSVGKASYEQVIDDQFHYTGKIRLPSQCLKCHLPMRRDNRDRVAGLVISMPVKSHGKAE